MNVSVKICGIRSVASALAAIDAGADFIGLNFVQNSKREINEETASEIIAAVKGQIKIVGVFQNADKQYVNETADKLGLDFVQLHGSETVSFINQIHTNVIRTISLRKDAKIETVLQEMQHLPVPFFLLDREVQGTGALINSHLARQIANEKEIFFAGGLHPGNVADIVREVQPFAVDVAGGIETDGKEDFEKIRTFVRNAKGVQL